MSWSVSGGEFTLRWNRELLLDLDIGIRKTVDALADTDESGHDRFAVRSGPALIAALRNGSLDGFRSGGLRVRGGYLLGSEALSIDLVDFEVRAGQGGAFDMDLVGRDGRSWFSLVRPMYEFSEDRRRIEISTMDVVISEALADRLGRPQVAGWTVAELGISSATTSLPAPALATSTFHWPNMPAPNGGKYQLDLFMKSIQFQFMRCDGCTGLAGSGKVVFTPMSTLRNNTNDGMVGIPLWTVEGDPLGYSTALWVASVAWYSKFSGIFAPYQNDQHPYLIWNMYRVNATGGIEQIGRSGLKHAYLTTNHSCLDENDHDSHVLGRGCEDTYTLSNNDNSNALGPRSEVIPATGQWGRCGSVYDPACTGQASPTGYGPYDQRLVVKESQISSAVNPGANYLFESWYVARDDINIYNSMATVRAVPAYAGGVWNVNNQSTYRLGPAIDRWVDPANPGQNAASSEMAVAEGHVKIAVKATYIGGVNLEWRYNYAFANLDFSRALTSGNEPNLRVLRNDGFDQIAIPIPAAGVTNIQFKDADDNPGNDWTVSQGNGSLLLTAPAESNRLNWGNLYSLSFVSRTAPTVSSLRLRIAEPGMPSSLLVGKLLAPAIGDLIYRQGFER